MRGRPSKSDFSQHDRKCPLLLGDGKAPVAKERWLGLARQERIVKEKRFSAPEVELPQELVGWFEGIFRRADSFS